MQIGKSKKLIMKIKKNKFKFANYYNMENVLIVCGHSDLNNDSVANKQIIENLKKLLPDAEISILNELYPDYKIDTEKEQKKTRKIRYNCTAIPTFLVWDAINHEQMDGRYI